MASASSRSVPLPYGKKYYCNFIYNYAARRNLVTDDTKLSLKFVEFLVGKLKDWGYTQCYYYDENARPGADVFDQLFDAAKNSMLTLVILTEYFSQNLWVRYSGKAVFKTLIGENKDSRDKLIPIVLGNAPVPDELDVNDVLSFDVDENTWHDEKHEQQLKKLRRVLDEGVPRADIKFPIQDYGDGIQRSEGGHIIVNPLPSMPVASNITQDRNERQMESLSSSVAAIHISNTLALPPGSLATSSKALQDCETSPSFRTELEPAKDPAMVPSIDYYTLKLELLKDGNILHDTESKTRAYVDKGRIVFDYDMRSQCLRWEAGSVIIYLTPLKKLTKDGLLLFCQHGGMENFLSDLLKRKIVFSSLPEGEMSIGVQVCYYDKDSESEGADGQYRDNTQMNQRDNHSDNPQVIKKNLGLQYYSFIQEIDPIHLEDTFVTRNILEKSFFDELKSRNKKERAHFFLETVMNTGDTAIAALAHALRNHGYDSFANRLCIVLESSDEGQMDDGSIEVVQVDSATHAQEHMLWSCKLKATVRKNKNEHGDGILGSERDDTPLPSIQKGGSDSSLNSHVEVGEGQIEHLIGLPERLPTQLSPLATSSTPLLDFEASSSSKIYEEHGDGLLGSERDDSPLPSIQKGGSDSSLNSHVEVGEGQIEHLIGLPERLPTQLSPLATSSAPLMAFETSSSSRIDDGHVMLSYNSNHKQVVLEIKSQLANKGYSIWIDKENMGPKLLESMADAVERAHVVLLCMSEAYRNSKNCKREALYADSLNKTIIPLKMEDIKPKSWLGILTVEYIYYDFSGKKPFEEEMANLLKALSKCYEKKLEQPQIVLSVVSPEQTGSAQGAGASQSTGSG